MRKILLNLILLLGVFTFSSCDLDLLDSPNDVNINSANVDFLLNRVQVDFASFYHSVSLKGGRVTRIYHQPTDTYEIAHQGVTSNGLWNNAYANILNDIKTVKSIASERGFLRHLGIAKTLEAYVLMTLVDFFGDVPLSEALDPNNFNPKVDSGESIYNAAFQLLESAKEDFASATSIGTPKDFYYSNNYTRWIKLANTLQLKYHLNRRLIDPSGSKAAIDALIADNKLLGNGDDFIFRYGTNANDPDSRHPFYSGQFPNGGGDYQSVFFMWHLTEAKGFDDPRANYYFYRQVGVNPTNEAEVRCINEFPPLHYPLDMVWCMPGTRGYWGRDHLDNQGIPPDGLLRTLYGIFPAGGPFDANAPASISASLASTMGAGIEPIMLAAYVDFMLAEAALQLNTAGSPKDLMISGATKHINFVRSWSLTTAEAGKITAFSSNGDFEARRAAYIDKIGADFDSADGTQGQQRILSREYWISLYGNGVEAYNLYRRTGQPDGMQPGQIPNFGKFPRTFLYPNDLVTRNKNVEQKSEGHDARVFWDNNPPGFID